MVTLAKKGTIRAFSVIELLITVACLAVLAVLFLPALRRAKMRSARLSCVNYMKQIGLAFRTFSLDNNDRFPMQVLVTNGGTMELVASGAVFPHFQAMSNELSTPKILLCPEDAKRTSATNFTGLTETNLSYFIDLDATNESASSLLIGDRNITNRGAAGNRLVPLVKGDTLSWTRELHIFQGYLGFGDGSVNGFRVGTAGTTFQIGNGATNWLAVP